MPTQRIAFNHPVAPLLSIPTSVSNLINRPALHFDIATHFGYEPLRAPVVLLQGEEFPLPTITNVPQFWEKLKSFVAIVSVKPIIIDPALLMQKLAILTRRFDKTLMLNVAASVHEGFTWPPAVYTRDKDRFIAANNSIPEMIRRMHESKRTISFNADRVREFCSHDPELDRLLALAAGVVVDLPEGFIPCPGPNLMRTLQLRLLPTIKALKYKLWQAERGVILPTSLIQQYASEFQPHWSAGNNSYLKPGHYQPIHWCSKEDDPAGRILIDPSGGLPLHFLNTEDSKLQGIIRYGKVVLPTIRSIGRSWIEYCLKEGITLADCRIWKDDISSAFCQLNIDPRSAVLFTTVIDEEFSFINSSGSFGWHTMPMAWGVISRALDRLFATRLSGPSAMYVDDLIALSRTGNATSDQTTAQTIMRQVLNPTAVSAKKSVSPGQVREVIGWEVDLHLNTIRPNNKGIEKCFFAFITFSMEKRHELRVYQCLASLAERYSMALLAMRPFVRPLQHMCHVAQKRRSFPDSAAQFSIEVWQIVAILLLTDPNYLNIQLPSICGYTLYNGVYINDMVYFISDASPWKMGAGLYSRDRKSLIAYTSFPFNFRDPKNAYQNVREYCGMLLSMILFRHVCPHVTAINAHWTNDNVSALDWAMSNKCGSIAGQSANIITAWFQIHSGISISDVQHIPGVEMGIIDDISRDVKNPLLSSIPYADISSPSFRTSSYISDLFRLCDPTMEGKIVNHHTQFSYIHNALNNYFRH